MPEPIDYTGNTNKSKEAAPPVDKKIEKIVTGEVIQQKPSFGKKFKGIFFGGDAKAVGRSMVWDVVIPAVKNTLYDMITRGGEKMIFGDSPVRRRPTTGFGSTSRMRYDNPVRRDRPYLPDQNPTRVRQVRRDTNDYVVASKEEAERVLERMIDIVDNYQVVSIADLHEMLGLASSHIDNKWGWNYLNNVQIRQVRDGFLLELPDAEEI